jgi:two-component system repressor protein LuxO
MQGVYRTLETAAPSNATVFVTGESGTGKELAAEAVHPLSPRAGGPFVALNCVAIPAELIETELFGHVEGAFTGAVRDRDGAIRQAAGGTLFLDEICEMQIDLQSRLLHPLQPGTYQPVGGRTVHDAERITMRGTGGAPAAGASTDPSAWSSEREVTPLAAIERAITLCDGNIPRAAGFLGVSPSTLYRKRQAWAAAG